MNSLVKPVGAIPLDDRIIVRRVKEAEETKGGIYLAEVAKEKPCYGVVLAAGDHVRNRYLARGCVMVAFGKYVGTDITVDGETLLTMREDEVSVIITDRPLIEYLEKHGV